MTTDQNSQQAPLRYWAVIITRDSTASATAYVQAKDEEEAIARASAPERPPLHWEIDPGNAFATHEYPNGADEVPKEEYERGLADTNPGRMEPVHQIVRADVYRLAEEMAVPPAVAVPPPLPTT